MKIKYYLVLWLVFCSQFLNANGIGNRAIWSSSYLEKVNDPVLPPLPNLEMCDDNNDGITSFNITIQTPIILASQSTAASNYSVSYHLTATDATTGFNAISNTGSYINLYNPQTIYARVQNNSTSQFEVGNFQLIVNPLPTLITPPDFSTCDTDGVNDGYYSFSLSSLIPSILGQSQNPSNYSVTFYDTLANAQSNTNAISNLVNYQAYTHTIWIRVSNNITGCWRIGSFNIIVEQLPEPIIFANSPTLCVDYSTNNVVAPVTLTAINTTNYLIQNPQTSYLYQWYNDGVPVGVGSTHTISSPLPNSGTSSYTVEMISNSISSCNGVSAPFSIFQSGPASPIGIGYSIVNNAGNQVITVEVEGYGSYEYQLDSGPQQSSNVFSNVTLGTHTITVYDIDGGVNYSCNPIIITNVNVNLTPTPPPTGSALQSFNQGATLANMQVTGQNIQWYSGANKNAVSSPLPLSTLLVDGTTYFASQKIGGYESTTRLPVTAQIVLANAEFELSGLVFAPNPVSNILKIKSDEVINEVSVFNFLGQIVLNKKIVGSEIEIDLISLNAANYFVKVQSGTKNSNFKIAKY
jgi:hypothetical protein